MESAKVSEYFKESQGFDTLPSYYQEKVIRFFSEDRHYMVDVSDVRVFLSSGQQFMVCETFEEMARHIKNNAVKGVIACKKCNWPSMDAFTRWGERVASLTGEGIEFVLLAHVFQFETDTPEEWYVVSC